MAYRLWWTGTAAECAHRRFRADHGQPGSYRLAVFDSPETLLRSLTADSQIVAPYSSSPIGAAFVAVLVFRKVPG